jgi:hypothetical protein
MLSAQPGKETAMREPVRAAATVAVNVRLPIDLHERLVQLAAREYRSLNREMLVLVQEALAERERQLSDEHSGTPYMR